MTTGLEQFYGTYLGFSPTDESRAGLGELEIIITESLIKSRMATGYEIVSEETPTSILKPMSEEEMKKIPKDKSSSISHCVGFDGNGIKYIFFVGEKDDEVALVIKGSLGDFLGPTLLFGYKQIEGGVYKKIIDVMEKEYGRGCYPTLENGGKASKDLEE